MAILVTLPLLWGCDGDEGVDGGPAGGDAAIGPDAGGPGVDGGGGADAGGSDGAVDMDAAAADDASVAPDGRVIGPDGRVIGPDGRAIGPDGQVIGPDGAICTRERTHLQCTNGVDDDCDGLTDRDDDGCTACVPAGAAGHTREQTDASCSDGLDNDCDGYIDCHDFDCRNADAVTACPSEDTAALCSDGLDNDGNRRVDCNERSCASTSACQAATATAEACDNVLDDDQDGYLDCDDADCADVDPCADPATEDEGDVSCDDGVDNDGDGYVDCVDFDCREAAACALEQGLACDNGADDDGDGLADCADPSCYLDPEAAFCQDRERDPATCSDGEDDDLDGLADCRDADCVTSCRAAGACSDANWFGTCSGGDEVCALGTCALPLSAFDLAGGARPVVMSELMVDAAGTDADREYIELTNVSEGTITLRGMELRFFYDTALDEITAAQVLDQHHVLSPGQTLLLLVDDDADQNGGLAGVRLGFGLSNTGDTISIAYGAEIIHELTWVDADTNDLSHIDVATESGVSYSLDGAYLSAPSTAPPRWCLTPETETYLYTVDPAEHGSPGMLNPTCP